MNILKRIERDENIVLEIPGPNNATRVNNKSRCNQIQLISKCDISDHISHINLILYKKDNNKVYCQIDYEDYDIIKNILWRIDIHNYVVAEETSSVGKRGKKIYLHRYIMEKYGHNLENLEIDHINNIRYDNRKINLRTCTKPQNCYNRKMNKDGCTSKYKGVSYRKDRNKWITQLTKNGKNQFIGRFDNEIDAAKFYNEKCKEVFGDLAKLNLIEE